MKKLFTLLALVLCSCAETFVGEEIAKPNSENLPDLTAAFAEEDATRTYIEDGKYLRWNEDDRLTIFFGNTLNRQYKFNGQTGDNSGTFSLVADGMLGTGNAFDHIYALYPYNADARITDEGVISLTLPETQSYAENSFGLGANTMVAVTENLEDTFLAFKNVGGYLKLKLYNAEGATLKSIEVKGNNGEKLAGEATLSINFGEAPTLTMAESATDAITLDCGEGIALGTTAETATEFWVVLPATIFAEGLTITATNTEGKAFEKSTTKEVIIERNAIQPMAMLEAEFVATKPANNEIWYTATSKITPNYIGATIKSHTFDGATGHGVITFNTNITNISANAFANCYDLTGITLPESITSIGDYAFDVCYWLTNMTIPNSVTKIGRGVFQNCLRLENITLSNNITSIQEGTFANCEALTSVTIPASVTTIDKAAFRGCYALAAFDSKFASEDKRCVVIDGTLCAFAPAELTSYTLPNNVTSIAVVLYSEILESITIPESVRSIGSAAFYNCYNMTVVYCNVVTPPTLATYTFPEKTTTIYVPAQSVTAYKSASYWSDYADAIVAYDFENNKEVNTVEFNPNNCIYYRANMTGGWDSGYNNYRAYRSYIKCNAGGSEVEMKFRLKSMNSNRQVHLGSGGNLEKDGCDEFKVTTTGLYIIDDYDFNWKWADIGVEYTDLITLRFSGNSQTITINGVELSCNGLDYMGWVHLFSSYYRDYDEGEWKEYEGVPEDSELYYVKMWDADGNLTYLGHAAKAVNPETNNMEYCWYSNKSGTEEYQFANDAVNQGGYGGNF